jgi:hypothetical protein
MILIINKDNARLCRDGKWRNHANFGDFKECVKIYKRLSAAQTKASRIGGRVVKLPIGYHIDASGYVWEEVPIVQECLDCQGLGTVDGNADCQGWEPIEDDTCPNCLGSGEFTDIYDTKKHSIESLVVS